MSDAKISNLPGASTPLTGTEVLPVVQSGTTKKVAVSDLTVGRDVTTKQLIAAAIPIAAGVSGTSATFGTGSAIWDLQIFNNISGGGIGDVTVKFPPGGGLFTLNSINTLQFDTSSNVIVNTGNLIQGTTAKGVNFTANTPAAGMTSQLLNWYEEGTWTPTVTAGTGSLTAYTSSGIYTRIGRQVFIQGIVTLTNVGTAGGTALINGFPFTIAATYNPSGTCREMANTGEIFNVNGQQGSTYGYLASLTNGAITWTNNYKYSFNMVYTV